MNYNEVPIVQGVTVDPSGKAPNTYQTNSMAVPMVGGYPQTTATTTDYQGQGQQQQPSGMQHAKQPNQFRDVIWAILFIAHLIPMALYAVYSASMGGGGDGDGNGGQTIAVTPHLYWISIVALVAVGLSFLSLDGMMRYAESLVKAGLIFSVITSGLIALYSLMLGQIFISVLCFAGFAVMCCYAYFVWSRLPFAAANLRTALTAVKLNMGLVVFAFLFMAMGLAWSILFFLGFGSGLQQSSYPVIFAFFVSFYWVNQVLVYTVHVICAGVVATWWFSPLEAASCFSSALQDSATRALTFSFGSICFGAFLVAIVKALRATLEYARQQEDAQLLVCILDCILSCIQGMIEYLNKWAYVYVGIYGFSYLDAGREVINLFQARGWTVVITDDLVDNVLTMMSVAIGVVCGIVGLFVGGSTLASAGVEESPGAVAFFIGFIVGLVMSNIFLGVVGSAVNTVIVCYCEAPAEFAANHPELHANMQQAWNRAYPEIRV